LTILAETRKVESLNASQMPTLVLTVSQIPPEGKAVDSPLDGEALHLASDEDFSVEEGDVKGRAERGEDSSVHFRGRLKARVRLECGRCTEPFVLPVDEDLDLFFLPHEAEGANQEEDEDIQLSDRDMLVAYYTDDRIDLGDRLREQLHLDVPLRRLCREDCRGLCPTCGTNRNTGTCNCQPREEHDERMAPLRKLLEKKGN
jgi:uncharacterized protein